MASGGDGRRRGAGLTATLGASVASAALLLFGTGLQPVWWLTWLAPLPVLLLAPRASARRCAVAATTAHLLGMAGYARYLLGFLGLPVPLTIAVLLVTAAVFTGVVLLFRALLVRGQVLGAVLAAPAAWAGAEYLIAVLTPFGSNWAVANSQAEVLPVLQIVSVTGPWGVAFVVLVVATALAALAAPGVARTSRFAAAVAGALVLTTALGYGAVRLASAPAEPVRVSLVAAPIRGPQPHAGSPAGQALLDADLAWVRSLPAGATQLVVFPEKDLVIDDATLPGVVARFSAAAGAHGVTLVLGVEQHTGPAVYNTALVFPPDGSPPVTYHKRHPVPGVEDEVTPGTGPVVTARGFDDRVGVAICADLGQVSLGRAHGEAGVGLLVAPALDFDVDAWSQSRVQFMRGVENGFSVARAARRGLLTLTDPHGRVLAQAATGGDRVVAVTADVPLPVGGTPYTGAGDWFAWLCLATTALALVALVRSRPTARRAAGPAG